MDWVAHELSGVGIDIQNKVLLTYLSRQLTQYIMSVPTYTVFATVVKHSDDAPVTHGSLSPFLYRDVSVPHLKRMRVATWIGCELSHLCSHPQWPKTFSFKCTSWSKISKTCYNMPPDRVRWYSVSNMSLVVMMTFGLFPRNAYTVHSLNNQIINFNIGL